MRKYVVVVCLVITAMILIMPSVPAIELDTVLKTQKDHIEKKLELASPEKFIEDYIKKTGQPVDIQTMVAVLDNADQQQLNTNLLAQFIMFILNLYLKLYFKSMTLTLKIALLPFKIMLARASLLLLPLKILKLIIKLVLLPLKLMLRLIVLPFKLLFGIVQLLFLPVKILIQLFLLPLKITRGIIHNMFDWRSSSMI